MDRGHIIVNIGFVSGKVCNTFMECRAERVRVEVNRLRDQK